MPFQITLFPKRFQEDAYLAMNPVDIILLSREGILIDLLKFPQFFNGLMHITENRESEKPDGLRFVRGAQFERFGSGLITPRIRVRTLNKGAWKKKGTLSSALR